LRQSLGKVGPVITDNNNFIIDVDFGVIKEPRNLENKLKTIPGIVETGLFLDMAKEVYVGGKNAVNVLSKSIS
jgi:ribose 5-phosphate isomerase A